VSDIIGEKRNCFGQRMESDPCNDGMYAGVRKGNVGIHEGRFAPPRKNNSNAFSHLDMSQTGYIKYLQSTKQMSTAGQNERGTRNDRMAIAGVPLNHEPTAMSSSLLHSI